DGALAMAMIRWIIEHERYDRNFLAQPNLKVAEAAGEAAWCNATHLIINEKGHPRDGRYLRASDIGAVELAEEERYKDGDAFCVVDAATQAIVPHNAAKGEGRLFFDGALEVAGAPLHLKTAMTMLNEEAQRHSMDEY
ncbi:tetrathionate reductase subunit TtrA, partial [Streptococcus danieliae]|nr:tetrathionate reductase subunit TtrA [Streptococcus danieliae]